LAPCPGLGLLPGLGFKSVLVSVILTLRVLVYSVLVVSSFKGSCLSLAAIVIYLLSSYSIVNILLDFLTGLTSASLVYNY